MPDVHKWAESLKTTCARGNCLTLQIVVSCCKCGDMLSIIFATGLRSGLILHICSRASAQLNKAGMSSFP